MSDGHVTRDDLKNRIDAVQDALDSLKADVDNLPTTDKMVDADEKLTVGEEREVIIEDAGSGTKHGDPMARIDGIVTFLQKDGGVSVDTGQPVDVVITDVNESHAKGVIKSVNGDSDA